MKNVAILSLALSLLTSAAYAGIIYVADSGPDGDGTMARPCSSLGTAISMALSNGWECQITLLPGIHICDGTITLPSRLLSLRGHGPETTTLKADMVLLTDETEISDIWIQGLLSNPAPALLSNVKLAQAPTCPEKITGIWRNEANALMVQGVSEPRLPSDGVPLSALLSALSNLNASALSSGTVPSERLPASVTRSSQLQDATNDLAALIMSSLGTGTRNGKMTTESSHLLSLSNVIYVSKDTSRSWRNWTNSIAIAVTMCPNNGTVLVAPGEYAVSSTIDLNSAGKNIALVSMAGREVTILYVSGYGTEVRILSINSGDVVDGFTISNGYITGSDINGGGIYASGGTIRRCAIVGCRTGHAAGGVLAYTGTTIEDCLFAGCTSQWGGAILMRAGYSEVRRCAFNNNYASSYGGAVYVENDTGYSPLSENRYESNNSLSAGGAILIDSGCTPRVLSSVFKNNGNPNAQGRDIYSFDSGSLHELNICDTTNSMVGGKSVATVTPFTLTDLGTPRATNDATTKAYVDSSIANISRTGDFHVGSAAAANHVIMENDSGFIMAKAGSGFNLRLMADHANGGQIVMHSPVSMPGMAGRINNAATTSGYMVSNNYCRETSAVLITPVGVEDEHRPTYWWTTISGGAFTVYGTGTWSFSYLVIHP